MLLLIFHKSQFKRVGLTLYFLGAILLEGNTLLIKYSSPKIIKRPTIEVNKNCIKLYFLPCSSLVSTNLSALYYHS